MLIASMTEYRKLKTTPIKEIIFTVSYSETVGNEALLMFCKIPEIASKFENVKQGFAANIHADRDSKITTHVSSDGYMLKADTHIIQAKVGSFAFHKVRDYEPFQDLFMQFRTLWDSFVSVTGRLSVNNISLRYLNFIEIDENDNFDKMLNVKVEHPYDYELQNKMLQLQFKDKEIEGLSINVVIAKGKDGVKNGLIFDIILNLNADTKNDYVEVFEKFKEMKRVKNEIFFKTLTEYSLNKYYGD